MKENTRSIVVGIVVLIVVVIAIIFFANRSASVDVEARMLEEAPLVDEEVVTIEEVNAFTETLIENQTHEGMIVASGTATELGVLLASFSDNLYRFQATLESLEEPAEGSYYEAWLIQRRPFRYISLGELTFLNGEWTINYQSANDELIEYDYFVVTEEAEDSEVAPSGEYVAEGEIEQVVKDEEVEEEMSAVEEEDEEESENTAVSETRPADDVVESAPVSFTGEVLAGKNSPLLAWNAEGYQEILASGRQVVLYFGSEDCARCMVELNNALAPAFDSLVRSDVAGMVISLDGTEGEMNVASLYNVEEPNTKVVIVGGDAVAQFETDSWDAIDYLNALGE